MRTHQVIAEDLRFRQDLHSVELSRADLTHKVDFTEGTAAEHLERHKVIRPNPGRLFILLGLARRTHGLLTKLSV